MVAPASHFPWLTVKRGTSALVVSFPHTGTTIPAGLDGRLVSPSLARKDADWWIDRLYGFAEELGATIVHTAISRTVIDVNRDPSGAPLYPGQATTALCPIESFDGEPLYRPRQEPGPADIEDRRRRYFDPYHAALRTELERLRFLHGTVVLYDCHSIRSVIPHLFAGKLPVFNIGTNSGASCNPALTSAVAGICHGSGFSHVVNGRFVGGWITRCYGRPASRVHAIQMELACRGYMREPLGHVSPEVWPPPYDQAYAAPMRVQLERILRVCLSFAANWKAGPV